MPKYRPWVVYLAIPTAPRYHTVPTHAREKGLAELILHILVPHTTL